jgi:hypothetical protein
LTCPGAVTTWLTTATHASSVPSKSNHAAGKSLNFGAASIPHRGNKLWIKTKLNPPIPGG